MSAAPPLLVIDPARFSPDAVTEETRAFTAFPCALTEEANARIDAFLRDKVVG